MNEKNIKKQSALDFLGSVISELQEVYEKIKSDDACSHMLYRCGAPSIVLQWLSKLTIDKN